MAAEKQYETKIKKMLDKYGAYYVKYFGCGFTQAGVPDILACVGGKFVAIEVKAKTGKPSPLQIQNLKEIHKSGGYAILAYPDDFETLECLIKALVNNDDVDYAPFINRFL